MGSAYWTSVSQYVGAEAAKCSLELKVMTFVLVFEKFVASVIKTPIQDYCYWHGDYYIFFSLTVHVLYD